MSDLESMTKEELIAELTKARAEVEQLEVNRAVSIALPPNLSALLYSISLDRLVEGIWIIDKDANTVFANKAIASMLGYTTQEMLGRHLFTFISEENIEECRKNILKRKRGIEEVHDFEFMSKAGQTVYTRISTFPILGEDEAYAGAVASLVDLSDLHLIQKQDQNNFENAPIGMAHIDLDGHFIKVNNQYCNLMGYSVEELKAETFLSMTYPDDRQGCVAYKDQILAGERRPKFIKRQISRNGEIIWVTLSLSVVNDSAGEPHHLIAALEDISEQKRSDMVLQARLKLMDFSFDHSLEEVLIKIVDVIEDLTNSQIGFHHFLSFDQKILTLQTWSTRTSMEVCKREGKDTVYSLESAGVWADCIRSKGPVVHNDYMSLLHKNGLPAGHAPLIRELVVPIIRNDKIVSVLGVGNKSTNYTDSDIETATFLADLAWDIIERKKVEEKLLLSEERFRSYFELGLIGMAIVDTDKKWIEINDKFCEIIGYNRKEIEKLTWPDFTHPDDIDKNKNLFEKMLSGELDSYTMDKRYIRKNGEVVYVSILTGCTRNNDGSLDYQIAHIMDITDRVKAEQEAEWNLKLNSTLAGLYPSLVAFEANLEETSEIILNEAIQITGSLFGNTLTIDEFGATVKACSNLTNDCAVLKNDTLLFSVAEDGTYPALWGHSLNTRKPFFSNNPVSHPKSKGLPYGHVKLTSYLSVPVLLGDKLVGQIAVANKPDGYSQQDVDAMMHIGSYYALAIQRVRSQTDLVASTELMENILDGIHAGILIIDPETKIIESINNVGLEMFCARKEQIIGQSCDIFCWRNTKGKIIKECPAAVSNLHESEFRIYRMNGISLPVSKTVLKNKVNGEDRLVEIIFDISKRKELERRLSLAQKLEAIGSLSAGIAHEINTPIQYLSDNLIFLSESFEQMSLALNKHKEICQPYNNPKCEEAFLFWKSIDMDYLLGEIPLALTQSLDGVERITRIVQAMKRFSHPGMDSKQMADINLALDNTATVCRSEWKYNSDIIFDLGPDLPLIPCFINDLNQAFLNILVNAAHAITSKVKGSDEKGTITIRTRFARPWIIIEIEDTGEGIPDEIMPKIFDPFFTTKEVGLGTGQGLTLCYSIITEKHGGTIEFSSEIGIGTKCTIKLPSEEV
ncbi:PAS domain S-box protein [Desulfovibrio gilichinskyi]|uniref:histidine kinase n=1 Tax=Desulfovibrio gilichinskyi TaxID=1519643 RepID=A0A1X7CVW7_9BACT|nr:PAS domain S-box protein [Desulfovibrio gilichinskyi]SMF04132.1 PAS domain S-box-containing protein [Desulfovibrio gilichinskyi]